jgi:hypothetical protein
MMLRILSVILLLTCEVVQRALDGERVQLLCEAAS